MFKPRLFLELNLATWRVYLFKNDVTDALESKPFASPETPATVGLFTSAATYVTRNWTLEKNATVNPIVTPMATAYIE